MQPKILQLTFVSNVFTFNATIDHRLHISFSVYAEGLEDSNNDFYYQNHTDLLKEYHIQ